MEVYLLYGDSGEHESYSQLQGIYLTLDKAQEVKHFLEQKYEEYQDEISMSGHSYKLYEKYMESYEAYEIGINDCKYLTIETHVVKG